jgi:hypothetical protein
MERRNGFWKGLGWFLAPIALFGVGSSVGGRIASDDAVVLWFLGVPFLLVALIGAVIFYVRGRTDIGNGAVTALALGGVILLGTCVYNLGSFDMR